jgi:hypothetical protein
MALQSKFHAGEEFEHLEHARLHPANNGVLGLRGMVRSSIMSLADLEPLPLHSFDVECFEYRAEGHLVQSYAIPTWEDCLRMLSPDSTRSPYQDEETDKLVSGKLQLLLSN